MGNKTTTSGLKSFFRTFFATLLALIVVVVFIFSMIGGIFNGIMTSGKATVSVPKNAVLTIDMSNIMLNEQTVDFNPGSLFSSAVETQTLGIWNIVNAVKCAAYDDAIKLIYIKPDAVKGGLSQVEELRKALQDFRKISGKPVISYIENPTNGGYYLASVSDKIYMTPHQGGMVALTGISSQMTFLKDALDMFGINVQLIRHGKYKSAGEMFVRNNASKENMEQNESMINSIWHSWASKIAESRSISENELNNMLDNLELNFPEDFLEKGLVDELLTRGQLQDQIAKLSGNESWNVENSVSLADYCSIMNKVDDKSRTKIAVIYANGKIVDGVQEHVVAGDRFAEMIASVREDETIKAVVLRVNSPGGSVLASEKIKTELDLLKGQKPLVASYGDYAASGGYWISNNCDYIYSNETTLTGSIGVFSMIPDVSKTMKDKLHINITPVNSRKHGDIYTLMRPLDKEETNYMQASVEKIYDRFTTIVSDARGVSKEYVDEIAQGRVWTGAQAHDRKLVDAIGTLDDAITYAAVAAGEDDTLNNVQIVEYPKQKTTMEIISSLFSGSQTLISSGTIFEDAEKAFAEWKNAEFGKIYAEMPYRFTFR